MLGVCMALIDDEKDKKAFEKLYNKYKNKVHAISLNILKNEQLAEESTSPPNNLPPYPTNTK